MLKVTIDTREQSRIQSAKAYYEKQGLTVDIAELPIGDYIFTNGNDSVVFELKMIPDFITSIQDGRVFNQSIEMAENYNHNFVIIVGNEAERTKQLAISRSHRPVTVYQYIGAISSLNRYVTVIESYSPYIEETYYRMLSQATKSLKQKPIVKKFEKKHKNPAMNYLTYCVYGLNYKRANDIVNKLDLHTLEDLLYLDHKQLTSIDGIGPKLSDRIIETIQNETYEDTQ